MTPLEIATTFPALDTLHIVGFGALTFAVGALRRFCDRALPLKRAPVMACAPCRETH